jgi:hypothetical protein
MAGQARYWPSSQLSTCEKKLHFRLQTLTVACGYTSFLPSAVDIAALSYSNALLIMCSHYSLPESECLFVQGELSKAVYVCVLLGCKHLVHSWYGWLHNSEECS